MKLRFFDLETRSTCNIKRPKTAEPIRRYGLDNHIEQMTDITLVTWQDVDFQSKTTGPVEYWLPMEEFTIPASMDHPVDYWVAWNSRFDRTAWNKAAEHYGLDPLRVDQVLDLMAQAMASGLPGKLDGAARALGLAPKKDDKAMLVLADASEPIPDIGDSFWDDFIDYGEHDTRLLYQIWLRTRELAGEEWEQFWHSEVVNDRGILVDLDLARAGEELAGLERESNLQDLREKLVTCGVRAEDAAGVTLHSSKWLNAFVFESLSDHEALQHRMVLDWNKDENGDRTDPRRISLDSKKVMPLLLEEVEEFAELDPLRGVLDVLSYARGSAVSKFRAMRGLAGPDGRVRGSYVFNGAGTGRWVSRGLQVHNMVRKTASEEFCQAMLDRDHEALKRLAGEMELPVAKALATAIRTCIIAEEGHVLVWGDWSAIEARMLPWLSNEPAAEAVLDIFRGGGDVYLDGAVRIFNLESVDDVDDAQRQASKVATLALGFGGAVGAYRAMARGYGMTKVSPEFAAEVVRGWREANPWARRFWDKLWYAFTSAFADPGVSYAAGRMSYMRKHNTIYCFLPSGRVLTYADVRRAETRDEDTDKLRVEYSYRHSDGRRKLWYGTLAENCTQGEAATLLRELLTRVSAHATLHTHDEAMLEVPEEREQEMLSFLKTEMERLPAWAEGLPLKADVLSGFVYEKR